MLRFVLPTDAQSIVDPSRVRAVGADDVVVSAEIRVADGLIEVTLEGPEARGIAIHVDARALVGGHSEDSAYYEELALSTCLLPQRDRPYSLVLELARRRVMLLLTKLEEWTFFEIDRVSSTRVAQAAQAFTKALIESRGGENGHTDPLAREALGLAIEVGRELALLQGRTLLPGRLSGEVHAEAVSRYEKAQQETAPPGAPVLLSGGTGVVLPGRPLVGCEVDPRIFSDGLGRAVLSSCDFLATPMRWSDLEPQEGSYAFTNTDRWIEWAVRSAKLPVAAGPLIDFRPDRTPEWLEIWENDHETLRELVAEHVKQVVTRYRRTVRRWSATCGLAVNRDFPMDFEKMIDLTRIAVTLIRKLHPQANVVVEVEQPWGEYVGEVGGSVPPLPFAEMTQQAGIQVDGFALRLCMGQENGSWNRDPMELSAMLDRYAVNLERPLLVTAVGAPSDGDGWSEARQAEWLEDVMGVVLAKPYIHSFCWQTLYDTEGSPPVGLVTKTGAPKASAERFTEIRRALREGRSPWAQPQAASA